MDKCEPGWAFRAGERRAWRLLKAKKISIVGLELHLPPDDPIPEIFSQVPDDFVRYQWRPVIEYAVAGEDLEWAGGLVRETGWYIEPYCTPACCRPCGPFPSWPEALLHSRRRLLEGR